MDPASSLGRASIQELARCHAPEALPGVRRRPQRRAANASRPRCVCLRPHTLCPSKRKVTPSFKTFGRFLKDYVLHSVSVGLISGTCEKMVLGLLGLVYGALRATFSFMALFCSCGVACRILSNGTTAPSSVRAGMFGM